MVTPNRSTAVWGELLDGKLLLDIDEMKYVVARWRMDCKHYRPPQQPARFLAFAWATQKTACPLIGSTPGGRKYVFPTMETVRPTFL